MLITLASPKLSSLHFELYDGHLNTELICHGLLNKSPNRICCVVFIVWHIFHYWRRSKLPLASAFRSVVHRGSSKEVCAPIFSVQYFQRVAIKSVADNF